MLLRRITKHVKDQNWFAVGLDFVIVVVGVGVALAAQQWLSDREQRAELVLAEVSLQTDLANNYFYARERVSLTDCRVEAYQAIAEQLLAPGETWIGMPRSTDDPIFRNALPQVFRSPSRNWGSRNWEAGLARGTFDQMDKTRKQSLDGLFQQTNHAHRLEDEIYTLQGQMKALAVASTIGQSDRLRYYDMLGEIDDKGGLLELISRQIAIQIEDIGIDLPAEERAEYLEAAADFEESRVGIYGDCVSPLGLSALEDRTTEPQAATKSAR